MARKNIRQVGHKNHSCLFPNVTFSFSFDWSEMEDAEWLFPVNGGKETPFYL